MKKFRQKSFAIPLIAAAGRALAGIGMGSKAMGAFNLANTGLTVGGMVQGSKQAKAAEQQQREANKFAERQQKAALKQQEKENLRLTRSLNNLAKSAAGSDPQTAAQVGHVIGETQQAKMFSSKSSILKELGRFGKDLIRNVGSGVGKEAVTEKKKNIFGLIKEVPKRYKTDKYIYRTKRTSTGLGKVGKTLIDLGSSGAAIAGTGYVVDKIITRDARKTGMMPKKEADSEKNFSAAGTYVKKGIKYAVSKKNLKNVGGSALFVAGLSLPGYLINKKQYKDQIKSHEGIDQKEYSVNSVLKNIKRKAMKNAFLRHPGQTITGGLSNLMSFGKFGRKEIKAYGKRLQGKDNGIYAKKLGKYIVEHPNQANLGGALIGAGIVGTAFTTGDKIIRNTVKHLDEDAYAYENYKNKPVEE